MYQKIEEIKGGLPLTPRPPKGGVDSLNFENISEMKVPAAAGS